MNFDEIDEDIIDEVIEQVDELLASIGRVASIWSIGDVSIMRRDLSKSQCWAVLKHACEAQINSISFSDIALSAAELFPDGALVEFSPGMDAEELFPEGFSPEWPPATISDIARGIERLQAEGRIP